MYLFVPALSQQTQTYTVRVIVDNFAWLTHIEVDLFSVFFQKYEHMGGYGYKKFFMVFNEKHSILILTLKLQK